MKKAIQTLLLALITLSLMSFGIACEEPKEGAQEEPTEEIEEAAEELEGASEEAVDELEETTDELKAEEKKAE